MKRILFASALIIIGVISANAYWQSRTQVSISSSSYQGPGDIVSGATMWGSCARAYNVAYANGTNPLCDLVATVGGAAVCTLRVATTGFVDLTGAYCSGAVTPATACTGGCKITKVYDQAGNTNHWTQVTLASMPALNFSGANSLPAMECANASNTQMSSPAITQAQPFTLSSVWERTGATTTLSNVIGAQGNPVLLGAQNSANLSAISAGTVVTQTANDNVFHALTGVYNSTSSAMNTDGTDISSVDVGTANPSATAMRICRSSFAATMTGLIMEVGMWPSAFNATQRGNMNTNQHSAANGYNF